MGTGNEPPAPLKPPDAPAKRYPTRERKTKNDPDFDYNAEGDSYLFPILQMSRFGKPSSSAPQASGTSTFSTTVHFPPPAAPAHSDMAAWEPSTSQIDRLAFIVRTLADIGLNGIPSQSVYRSQLAQRIQGHISKWRELYTALVDGGVLAGPPECDLNIGDIVQSLWQVREIPQTREVPENPPRGSSSSSSVLQYRDLNRFPAPSSSHSEAEQRAARDRVPPSRLRIPSWTSR